MALILGPLNSPKATSRKRGAQVKKYGVCRPKRLYEGDRHREVLSLPDAGPFVPSFPLPRIFPAVPVQRACCGVRILLCGRMLLLAFTNRIPKCSTFKCLPLLPAVPVSVSSAARIRVPWRLFI